MRTQSCSARQGTPLGRCCCGLRPFCVGLGGIIPSVSGRLCAWGWGVHGTRAACSRGAPAQSAAGGRQVGRPSLALLAHAPTRTLVRRLEVPCASGKKADTTHKFKRLLHNRRYATPDGGESAAGAYRYRRLRPRPSGVLFSIKTDAPLKRFGPCVCVRACVCACERVCGFLCVRVRVSECVLECPLANACVLTHQTIVHTPNHMRRTLNQIIT